MKQMPLDVTFDNLAKSDWFKNARSQVGPEYYSGNLLYARQPGFDIDEEWIKANDPNAYKTYGFKDNSGVQDYDKFGKLRNHYIDNDARDFADFMDEHPELNYSDVISAYGDRYKKATGKDFPMEEFRGYSDKHSEDLNIKKFDKELYNTAKEALGENDHFSDIPQLQDDAGGGLGADAAGLGDGLLVLGTDGQSKLLGGQQGQNRHGGLGAYAGYR